MSDIITISGRFYDVWSFQKPRPRRISEAAGRFSAVGA